MSEPPNPFRLGTYAWARAEFHRGRAVWRASWPVSMVCSPVDDVGFEWLWTAFSFTDEDFEATDWRRV